MTSLPRRRSGPAALLASLGLVLTTGACATQPPPLPLRPEPIPLVDTLPIPEPDEQDENRFFRTFLVNVPREMAEPFRVPEGEALNITHFDDVVPSAWFERRMGYDAISPARLAEGPALPDGRPAESGPLTVRAAKTEGVAPGFTLRDVKGDTYIVKFDARDHLHMQTSAGVISNRLMWGAGYHVPSDYLLVFDSARLVLGEDVTIDAPGGERPMTEADVREVLEKTRALPDGRFLALASKFVPGIPKGPFLLSGRRDDDPNDHYRHEYRRELRGLRVVSSWVNNTDLREGNLMDVYVEPGYLRHYVIDFGATLGSASIRPKHPKDEVEQPLDFWRAVARLATLGLYREGWEDEPWDIPHPSLGYMRAEAFRPAEWNAYWENPAFFAMTPADAYWGAKIVASFTDAHIRAAVEEGGLPEPWLVDTLTATLATRRDILVRHWYGEVTSIEEPRAEDARPGGFTLTFRDLGLEEGLWDAAATTYTWELEHDALDRKGGGRARATEGALQRLDIRWEGDAARSGLSERDALAELEVRVERPGRDPRAATVWLRWTGERYEVVGLEH